MKLTVRTLDSQNHEFEIENEEITVKEFKELIYPTVKVNVEKQRIIFKGKVLKDHKKLKEYGVDGFVVHLVESAPPSSSSSSSTVGADPERSTSRPRNGPTASSGLPPNVYIGALGGSADDLNVQSIVSNLISQFGANNVTANHTGNSLNVNVNIQQPNQNNDVSQRVNTARRFLAHGEHLVQHIDQSRPSNENSCPRHYHRPDGNHSHSDHSHSHHRHHSHHHHHHHRQHLHAHSVVNPSNEPNRSSISAESCHARMKTNHQATGSHTEVTIEDAPDNESPASDPSRTQQPSTETDQEQEDNSSPHALGRIYNQFLHLYQHLYPHLRRYEYLLNHPDARDRTAFDNNLPDQIAEIFHDLSHAMHAMSDLSYNFATPNSQTLMCFPSMSPMFPMPFQQGFISSLSRPGQSISNTSTSSIGTTSQTGPRPVAVASISTVVQIPAGSMSADMLRNAAMRSTPDGASTSEAPPLSQSSTSFATTSSHHSTTSVSQSIPNQPIGTSPVVRGTFGSTSGNNNIGNNISNNNSNNNVRINMSQFRPTGNFFSFNQNTSGPSAPSGLQSIMQNIMQSSSPFGSFSSGANATTNQSSTNSTSANTITQPSVASNSTARNFASTLTDENPIQSNQSTTTRRPNHQPHPHHHHHNNDGSVIHPDKLLPCGSFHFGPTFHQDDEPEGVDVNSQRESPSTSTSTISNESSRATASTSIPSHPWETTTSTSSNIDLSNILNGIFQNMPNVSDHAELSVRIESEDQDVEMASPENNLDGHSGILQNVQQSIMQFLGDANNASGVPGGTNNRQTLRTFMRENFGLNEESNGTFSADFVDVIADNLTMTDLIGMFLGTSTEPWNHVFSPMRQLIEKHFNDNRTMNESHITEVASRVAAAIADINGEVETNLEIQADVDLKATLNKLDKAHMEKLIGLLLGPEATFASGISDWYKQYCAWNFAILDRFVTGGADRFLQALLEYQSINQLFQDISPSLRQFTIQTISSRVRASISTIQITDADIESVVVRPTPKVIQRENPCKEETGSAAKRVKKNERVDVGELWDELHGGADVSSDSDVDGDSPSPQEDWHCHVPNDWVLVINRDVERQRNMSRQRPYSDAYLSGLCPKKRQMLSQHSKDADRVDVGATLKRSIRKCGMKPKSVEAQSNALEKEISESGLQEMFESTFRQDIRKRLQNDKDYQPQQFPKSEEYYMKDRNP